MDSDKKLTPPDLADADRIGRNRLRPGSIQTWHIEDAAITNAKIASLSADKITAGTISASVIGAGTITADKMSVSSLSAISANLGTITAGTVTGATLQTASSGQRVVIDTSNKIKFYASDGVEYGEVYSSTSLTGTGTAGIGIFAIGGGDIAIANGISGNIFLQPSIYTDIQGVLKLTGSLWSSGTSSSGIGTPATVNNRLPIYNNSGTIIGYIPIYNTL